MSKSRLEKFLYALYSLDSSDLPNPLSRIEELYNCLVTGEEAPSFEPISRVEKYLMAILGAYNVDELPNPLSRVEVLLYKLATGDDNLDDVKSFLSEHEELLSEIIRNGGVGGNIDIEYVLYTLSTEFNTLYNTAEKPVKSAILKGNTLVNLFNVDDSLSVEFANSRWKYQNRVLNLIGGNKYYVYFFNKLNNLPLHIKPLNTQGERGTFNVEANTGKVVTLDSTITNAFGYYLFKDGWTGEESKQDIIDKCKILFFEYQEGMENWDIPYFEGMKSVKMPVLTTTGNNLCDNTKLSHGFIDANGVFNNTKTNFRTDYINIKSNTNYIAKSHTFPQGVPVYCWFDENKKLISRGTDNLSPINAKYLIVFFNNSQTNVSEYVLENILLQVEEGSTTTPYEPYKSNILTVNEKVELGSVGDTRDTLNLITGEVVISTYDYTITGDEDWLGGRVSDTVSGAGYRGHVYLPTLGIPSFSETTFVSDKFKKNDWSNGVFLHPQQLIYFTVPDEVEVIESDLQLKDFIKRNSGTIKYPLAEKSIKTVDLSVVDQDGNNTELKTFNDITYVTLSSEGLIPEAELEVVTKNEEDLDDSIVYRIHTLSEEFNTLYNTAEKPVKSAILKGQTYNNICIDSYSKKDIGNSTITQATYKLTMIDKSKNYDIYFDVNDSVNSDVNINITIQNWAEGVDVKNTNGRKKVTIESNQIGSDFDGIAFYFLSFDYSDGARASISNIVVVESNNYDLPYFTDMKSVQMPVLTTTGKNLFDGEWEVGSIHPETGGDVINENSVRTKDFFVVESNKEYTISNNKGYTVTSNFYDYEKNIISTSSAKTFITPSNSYFVKFRTAPSKFENDISIKFQIEQGSISTSYEPYKSNILTTSEEVELRGVGGVQDELNLLTGELTQRIEEFECQINSVSVNGTNNNGNTRFVARLSNTLPDFKTVLFNNYNYQYNPKTGYNFGTDKTFSFNSNSKTLIYLTFKPGVYTADTLLEHLQQNPLILMFQLATESIKTVDLSVVNQDGNDTKLKTFNDITHVTLSSEGLIPEAELKVAEKVPEVAANMLGISREQEVINTATNEQSENVDSTMIATTEIYEGLL